MISWVLACSHSAIVSTGDTARRPSFEPSLFVLLSYDVRTGEVVAADEDLLPLADTYEFPDGLITGGEPTTGDAPRSVYAAAGAYVYAGPTPKYGPLLSANGSIVGPEVRPEWVAHGDIDGDGVLEVLVAVEGGSVQVRDADGALRVAFEPFGASPSGAIRVTTGDVDGDGTDEVIALDAAGSGGRVAVVDGVTKAVLADFFALAPLDPGIGVSVAAQDVDGDGADEVLVGAINQGQPTLYAARADVSTGQATPLWSIAGPALDGRPALGATDYVVFRGPDLTLVEGFGTVPSVIEVVSDPSTGGAMVRVVDPTAVLKDPVLYIWFVGPEVAPFGASTRYTGHATESAGWESVDLAARRE